MKNTALLFILLVLCVQSCQMSSSGVRKNDRIDKEVKLTIRSLNDRLFNAMINKDIGAVQGMMSLQYLEKNAADVEKRILKANASFESTSYRMLDEYHVLDPAILDSNTVHSGATGDNNYMIHCPASEKEIYVSLFFPNGQASDFLSTAIYEKQNAQWKLVDFQFGQYGLFGKNAVDYYKTAKDAYDKGLFVDALVDMEMVQICLRPAGTIWEYEKEQEINAFDGQLKQDFNTRYPFPFILNNVENKPQIFKIHAGVLSDGYHPMVSYLTTIALTDEAALETEYAQVKEEVNKLFPGINKGKKYVFYRAYNTIPDGETKTDHYGFVDEDMK